MAGVWIALPLIAGFLHFCSSLTGFNIIVHKVIVRAFADGFKRIAVRVGKHTFIHSLDDGGHLNESFIVMHSCFQVLLELRADMPIVFPLQNVTRPRPFYGVRFFCAAVFQHIIYFGMNKQCQTSLSVSVWHV